MEGNINIQTTAARLRKTFQYPTDESSENSPDALDEEEQETLIATLAEQNEARNNQFRQFLLLLPAISSIPYFLFLLTPPPSFRSSTTSLLALLSLSSLASTAFLVWRTNPSLTGIPFLDKWTGATVSNFSSSNSGYGSGPGLLSSSSRQRRRRSSLSARTIHLSSSSPLDTYLPYLNGVLCVLAFLTGFLQHRQIQGRYHESELSSLLLGGLPTLIYAAVLIAKVVMAGVDPERELNELRYEFKGA